jgi:hypothetical protein
VGNPPTFFSEPHVLDLHRNAMYCLVIEEGSP